MTIRKDSTSTAPPETLQLHFPYLTLLSVYKGCLSTSNLILCLLRSSRDLPTSSKGTGSILGAATTSSCWGIGEMEAALEHHLPPLCHLGCLGTGQHGVAVTMTGERQNTLQMGYNSSWFRQDSVFPARDKKHVDGSYKIWPDLISFWLMYVRDSETFHGWPQPFLLVT